MTPDEAVKILKENAEALFPDAECLNEIAALVTSLSAQLADNKKSVDVLCEENDQLYKRNAALFTQLAEARQILAHTDAGSLPNDWTIKQVAEARIDDMLKLRDQVRDTCTRAEKAEAQLAEARKALGEATDVIASECDDLELVERLRALGYIVLPVPRGK